MNINKEQITNINTKYSLSFLVVILFVLSFGYIYFFSQCVPFFFDDHEFHRDYMQQSYSDFFKEIVSLNKGSISSGPRPVYGIFIKTLFPFFGFDYCKYRIIKALVFSLLVFLIYKLTFFLYKKKSIAILFSFYFMTTFPFYLQTLGYNGPHIFAEIFKILAISLFLYDITKERISYLNQFLIFLFALLGVRTYVPAYSIAGILPLFIVLYDKKKFMRYMFLFCLIILIQFPVTLDLSTFNPENNGIFAPKIVNIKSVFANDIVKNITNPIPDLSTLYYKSFTAIISFFGFWLIMCVLLCLLLKKLVPSFRAKYFTEKISEEIEIQKKEHKTNYRMILLLTLVWMVAEIQNYVFLPEHAIRYLFAFLLPCSLFILTCLLYIIENLRAQYKKYSTLFVLIMVFGIVLTNISYVYAFRAGWGSSFFAFEAVMDYIAEHHEGRTAVLYYAGSAATEYKYVNKSRTDMYQFGTENINYIQTNDMKDFTEEVIIMHSEEYDSFYVLRRVTSLSKAWYPDVALHEYESLQQEAVIDGSSKTLFDLWNNFFTGSLGIEYEPNKIYIYRYQNP